MKKLNYLWYLFIGVFFIIFIVLLILVIWQMTNFQYGPVGLAKNKLKPLSLPQDVNTVFPQEQELNLLAVGDIMLDRSVFLKTQKALDYNFPFLKITDWLQDFDLRIGNLEGPITDFQSVANGTGANRLIFTFSPQFLQPLKTNFDFFSLANNHTKNFGLRGLEQTRNYLVQERIGYFGDPENTEDYLSTTTEKNGFRLAFVGYHGLVENGLPEVLTEIKKLREQNDFIIVYPHWGVEYETTKISSRQRSEAHQLIEGGADLIIGTHPHVVQPEEEYLGKKIFYSLGNFIFDQYFSAETMQGLAVSVYLKKNYSGEVSVDYQTYKIKINYDSQPELSVLE